MNGFKLSFSYPHAYANKHLHASILNACLCLCVIYLIYLKRSLIQITCGFFFIYKYNMGWFLEALNILQYFNYRDMCGWVLRIICVHVSLHSASVISDPLPNKYPVFSQNFICQWIQFGLLSLPKEWAERPLIALGPSSVEQIATCGHMSRRVEC